MNAKKYNINNLFKNTKPEVIVAAVVFLVIIGYVVTLSIRNIAQAENYKNQRQQLSAETRNTPSAGSVGSQRSYTVPSDNTENPIKKVRAIVNDTIQINESPQWYRVGDVVDGLAEILAIEPTRILVEFNGTESYIPLDFTATAPQVSRDNSQQSDNFTIDLTQTDIPELQEAAAVAQSMQAFMQSLSPEQQAQIQTRMINMMQTLQNLSPQERTQFQEGITQLNQRLQGMSAQQRQEAMPGIIRQYQQWMLSNDNNLPNITLD